MNVYTLFGMMRVNREQENVNTMHGVLSFAGKRKRHTCIGHVGR